MHSQIPYTNEAFLLNVQRATFNEYSQTMLTAAENQGFLSACACFASVFTYSSSSLLKVLALISRLDSLTSECPGFEYCLKPERRKNY